MTCYLRGRETLKRKSDNPVAEPNDQPSARRGRCTKSISNAEADRSGSLPSLTNLPNELLLEILCQLRPSDILSLVSVTKGLHQAIATNEQLIASAVISLRYPLVAICFPLPNLKTNRHRAIRRAPDVQKGRQSKKRHLWRRQDYIAEDYARYGKLYHPIDWRRLCSCTGCLDRWIKLNTVLDRWGIQGLLDEEETFSGPINTLGFRIAHESPFRSYRRRFSGYAAIISRATTSPLTYAALLEKHLATVARMNVRKQCHLMRAYRNDPSGYNMSCPAFRANCRKIPELESETDECLEQPTDRYLWRSRADLVSGQDYYRMTTWLPNRCWRKLDSPASDRVAGRWEYFVCEGNFKRSQGFGRIVVENQRPACICPKRETQIYMAQESEWWHEL